MKTPTIRLSAPAKINLFLRVLGRRSDGYHELCSLMACIGLFDTLVLTVADGPTTVCCDHPDVPEDRSNLAARAADLFFRERGAAGGAAIHIEKRIPVGAGLGGGSSDAAAVLCGLNRHFDSPFSRERLGEMAAGLGADVPFFVYGRPALATGIGQRLRPYPHLAPYPLLLVFPGFSVSTREVYKNLNLGLTKCENQLKYFPLMAKFAVERHLCNDLETVTIEQHPEIAEVKAMLMANGAQGALMSGSGSSVFGIFSDAEAVRSARQAISRQRRWQVFSADVMA